MTPREVIYDILDDEFAVTPDSERQTIHQLGLDSLDQVELVIRLEEHLGIDLQDTQIDSTTTVRYLIDLVPVEIK